MEEAIIEASNATHEWNSDYLGTESMSVEQARAEMARLQARAETDPEPHDDGNDEATEDGFSWRGWSFRLLIDRGDGRYRPE